MTASSPTLAKLKPNPAWAKLPLFNRKQWSRVRFGDVVENLNETVDAFRKKRNTGDYEIAGLITKQEADESVALARRLRQRVEDWLGANHPELLAQ